jgi:Zn-finger nucleic acid-binding protein
MKIVYCPDCLDRGIDQRLAYFPDVNKYYCKRCRIVWISNMVEVITKRPKQRHSKSD